MGWEIVVRFLVGAEIFSLRLLVQTGSEAHPASSSVDIVDSFPMSKAAGA
jgi:hypothetical protein